MLVALAAGLILAVTTFPTADPDVKRLATCLVCGQRGLADALLNIFLFAPLGATLALAGWRAGRAFVAAVLLSAVIEMAQLFVIPGRDPGVGDVVFNALGGLIGFILVASASSWLAPSRSRAALFAWSWSALVAVAILGTGALLAPSLSRLDYYGGWTMRLRHLDWYFGRVLEARVGTLSLPSSLVDDSGRMRDAVMAGDTLRVRAIAGPPPADLAPVVMINDAAQHEMMLLGIDRDDLVFRYRTRSTALRLGQPDLRAWGAVRGVSPGDSLALTAWREGNAYCLARDADRRCGIGFTAGRAWSILYPQDGSALLVQALDAAWMLALFIPLGFWLPATLRGALAVTPAAVALGIGPSVGGLLPATPAELAAVVIGLVAGHVAARGIRRRYAAAPTLAVMDGEHAVRLFPESPR